ncbi:class I glutamine amidotransferase-like protein [Thozetella sp. PMI_491]|nr:class I glutamine amidotransferase-like protein [Thozetella sp. PMI_491]
MRALIIKDYSTDKPWGEVMVESFRSHIKRRQPSAEVDVCGAADTEVVPDPFDYDLIVLTGGTVNLINGPQPPWVEEVLGLIREVAQKPEGKTKLLGCCWGHQAIQHALGGELGTLDGGARIGVERLPLTSEGQAFLAQDSLDLHKFHKRYVTVPASGFSVLAENNEILVSQTSKVLTFQSHPEFKVEIAEGLIAGDDGSYIAEPPVTQGIVLMDINAPHDGELVWDRIMKWATA